MRVGVISDTHGLLRPEVVEHLRGADLILHAGDVGNPRILAELHDLAPLLAVRGNVDRGPGLDDLPETLVQPLGDLWLYMLHDLNALDLSPDAAGFRVVVSGHSHASKIEERGDVLYLNPGACGPRRFKLPVSMAFLTVNGSDLHAELLTLDG